jgi:hypothetical protein
MSTPTQANPDVPGSASIEKLRHTTEALKSLPASAYDRMTSLEISWEEVNGNTMPKVVMAFGAPSA